MKYLVDHVLIFTPRYCSQKIVLTWGSKFLWTLLYCNCDMEDTMATHPPNILWLCTN